MALNFDLADGAYTYRALAYDRKGKPLRGWDVYALQTALAALPDDKVKVDGVFGVKTKRAVRRYQQSNDKLVVDGIAGIGTQRQLALHYARSFRNDLPGGLLKGQIEHESSFMLGNYTAPYANGHRDCGVCQRNTKYTPIEDGFDTPSSIRVLADRVSSKHDLYVSWGVVDDRRAWELAAGSWNAPTWTDKLAKGEYLGPQSTAHIEAYIDAVTVYVRW